MMNPTTPLETALKYTLPIAESFLLLILLILTILLPVFIYQIKRTAHRIEDQLADLHDTQKAIHTTLQQIHQDTSQTTRNTTPPAEIPTTPGIYD